MAYLPHYRLTAAGRFQYPTGGGMPVERWSWGVNLAKVLDGQSGNFGGTSDGAAQPNEEQFNDLVTDVSNFHTRAGSRISGSAVLEEVKLAWIGADGKYTRDPMISAPLNLPGGGGQSPFYPTQIALAVSLVTEKRGPRGRGRFYLPLPTCNLNESYTILDAERDQVQSSVAQFLNDLGNEPDVDVLNLTPVVASSLGTNSPVTGVRVGRVLDTIRSRRRSLNENYDPVTAVDAFE